MNWINNVKLKGDILYTGGMDKSLKLWDIRSSKELASISPSEDVIYDFDIALKTDLILVTFQRNYLTILSLYDDKFNCTIELAENEICEKAFFFANDNYIAVIVIDGSFGRKFKLYSIGDGVFTIEHALPFTEFIEMSSDKNLLFFCTGEKSVKYISNAEGKLEEGELHFDYLVTDFKLDEYRDNLIVLGGYIADIYNYRTHDLEERVFFDTKVERLFPAFNGDLILLSKNCAYYYDSDLRLKQFIKDLVGETIFVKTCECDSTILFAMDSLYAMNNSEHKLRPIHKLDELFETLHIHLPNGYYAISKERSVKLYNLCEPINAYREFSGLGVSKRKIKCSSSGGKIATLNSRGQIDFFSPSNLMDYSLIKETFDNTCFQVSDAQGIYALNSELGICSYLNGIDKIVYSSGDFQIDKWIFDEKRRLLKFKTLNNILGEIDLNGEIPHMVDSTLFNSKLEIASNDNLNSFIFVNSDNYSFCNFSFGDFKDFRKLEDNDCSLDVSEGMFNLGFSDDSSISYIDKDYEQLITVDSKRGDEICEIAMSNFKDEICDVELSLADNKVWVSSVDNSISSFDVGSGSRLSLLNLHSAEVNDIEVDTMRKLLYSVGGDGQFSVYSISFNRKVYGLYTFGNDNYLVKLPNSPYYMCSKDASKMLHYVTPSLKVIGFDQLDPVYNRPDIVLDSIGKYFGGADQELVANYRMAWEKRVEKLGLKKELLATGEIAVPNAEIANAEQIEYENKDGMVILHIKANDPKYTLQRYNVLVNEVPVYGSAGISIAGLNTKTWERTDTITLGKGRNKIQVSVMNELGLENFKYPTYVNYTPKGELASKTVFIGIGVNHFKESVRDLKYCVKDVQDLANEFASNQSLVDTLLLTDQEVTRESVLALRAYLLKNTTENDKVIISCSSHGLLDDSLNFYLAMHDVDFKNPKGRGLKYEELESLLDGNPARQKLLLLDACNSGENDKTELLKRELSSMEQASTPNAELIAQIGTVKGVLMEIEEENQTNFKKMNELFVNVRNNTGSVIISAAGGQQSALEAIEVDGHIIENGAFTFSVLEYLKQREGGKIKVTELKQYAEKRVEEITEGKQKPTSRQETMEVDWEVR